VAGSDDELRQELRALKDRVEAIEQRLAIEPSHAAPTREHPTPEPQKPKHHKHSPELETRLGLTWINRIGVITLLLGAGFFFKYAVENQWIGPMGRVILGVASGILALAGGDFLHRRNQRLFAQGISGLGIALLYLSFYAAYEFYHLIPDVLAFALLVATTAIGAALALQYEAIPVAALGLFGGYLTPVLVKPAPWVLYGYALLLDIAAVALSRFRGWRPLEMLALAATAILYATSSTSKEAFLGTFFLAAYYALFSNARLTGVRVASQVLAAVALAFLWMDGPTGYLLCSLALAAAGLAIRPPWALGAYWLGYALWSLGVRTHPEGPTFVAITLVFALYFAWSIWRPCSVVVVALNGPAYFAAAYLLLDGNHHAWMGLLAIGLAATHLIAARRLIPIQPTTAMLALGLGASFITIAVPVQFSGYTITIAWATEAAALAWIGSRLEQARATWFALAISAMILIRLAVFDRALTNGRLVSFAASAVAFWLIAKWMPRTQPALAVYVIGHAILLWALSMEIERWVMRTAAPENQASLIAAGISIMLAAYAVAMVAIGVFTATTVNRLIGLALIGIVIVKLYLYDVWLLDRLDRTIAFVALGALLVLSSYVYSRHRDRIEAWWRERS
jgi:uncharacterized membrane protein